MSTARRARRSSMRDCGPARSYVERLVEDHHHVGLPTETLTTCPPSWGESSSSTPVTGIAIAADGGRRRSRSLTRRRAGETAASGGGSRGRVRAGSRRTGRPGQAAARPPRAPRERSRRAVRTAVLGDRSPRSTRADSRASAVLGDRHQGQQREQSAGSSGRPRADAPRQMRQHVSTCRERPVACSARPDSRRRQLRSIGWSSSRSSPASRIGAGGTSPG